MSAAPAVLVALRRFVAERFPPRAAIPIAALLHAAPASLAPVSPGETTRGALATLVGLLWLRIADDLADLERDRRIHPERGLPSGAIDARRLRDGGLMLGAALLALEVGSPWRLGLALGACAFYRGWYACWRARIHVVARPFLSNLVFPFAVLHGAGPFAWRAAVPLALYAWFVAVAHELAHNVRPVEEDASSGPGYVRALGVRGAAVLSVAVFTAGGLAGVLLWHGLGRPLGLGLALAAAAVGLGSFLSRVVRDPGPGSSRALYRAGILFGLAPPLGLLLPR